MRSLLFLPGDSERKIAKGLGSAADGLILELENTVALQRKGAARELPSLAQEYRKTDAHHRGLRGMVRQGFITTKDIAKNARAIS